MRKTKDPNTWNEIKNGTAVADPHVPADSLHRLVDSSIIASAMIADQPSAVRHWKSRKKAFPNVSKLRALLRPAEVPSPS